MPAPFSSSKTRADVRPLNPHRARTARKFLFASLRNEGTVLACTLDGRYDCSRVDNFSRCFDRDARVRVCTHVRGKRDIRDD
jgi:predicted lipoprotein